MKTKEMTLKEIEQAVEGYTIDQYPTLIALLKEDSRNSVQKLMTKLQKKWDKLEKEQQRISNLWIYEKKAQVVGHNNIAGIDEAGRGPLAGPVVAAAVVLPLDTYIEGIDDSKKLSEKKREVLFDIIMDKALAVGIGIVDNKRIDEINILRATEATMIEAIKNLSVEPDYLLIDAVKLTDINIKQDPIVKGDQKSISIAAASIIAKVTRDRMMKTYHEAYPEYGFEVHKGYGTKEHYKNIKQYGMTPIHRRSFLKNF
ncbi:MAG: ribonuclease HII [Thermotaleaceae bacterium]